MKKKMPWKYVSIGIFAALTAVACCLIPFVKVNYDFSKYLAEDSISKQGYDIADQEFGGMNMAKVMVDTTNRTSEEYQSLFEQLNQKSEVLSSVVLQAEKPESHTALFLFTFSGRGNDPGVPEAVEEIREIAGENAVVCGTVIDEIAQSQYMASSALLASCILVPVVILLIMLTTKSFVSLLLVLVTLGVSVALNMGTNAFLDSVSFITQGIALALQLAITLDYAVFMIHEYERLRGEGMDCAPAIRAAIKKSFTSIFSACLTTVAGFLALMLMQFGIGMDLGLVFIKGILFSFASVIFLLPALLLVCDKAILKTVHRPLMPKFEKPSRGIYRARYVFVFLVFLLIPAILLQNNISYQFGSAGMISGEGVPSYDAKLQIAEIYGQENPIVLVYPKIGNTPDAEIELVNTLSGKTFENGEPMFNQIMSAHSLFQMAQNLATDQMSQTLNQMLDAAYPGFSEKMDWNIPYVQTKEEYVEEIAGRIETATDGKLSAVLIQQILSGMDEVQEGLDQLFVDGKNLIFSNFESENYYRIVLSARTDEESEAAYSMYETVLAEVENSGLSGVLPVGETPTAYDMRSMMTRDNLVVNTVSMTMVFLIIAITFRSISIPFLLLIPILTGIYINCAIPALMGTPVAYLGNLVVMMIHLGATIDYAILYANKYLTNRSTMDKKEATVRALSEAIPSILTSAIALTVAGYSLGWTAKLPATAQIGLMLGRAGLLSAFFTVFVLPGILCFCDPLIQKTTWNKNFYKQFTNEADCGMISKNETRGNSNDNTRTLSAGQGAQYKRIKSYARAAKRSHTHDRGQSLSSDDGDSDRE